MLPSNLSIDVNPIVTILFLTYGYTAVGSYKGLRHYVEIYSEGKKYDFAFWPLLDNENAVYGGREIWGYSKVLRTLSYDLTNSVSNYSCMDAVCV